LSTIAEISKIGGFDNGAVNKVQNEWEPLHSNKQFQHKQGDVSYRGNLLSHSKQRMSISKISFEQKSVRTENEQRLMEKPEAGIYMHRPCHNHQPHQMFIIKFPVISHSKYYS